MGISNIFRFFCFFSFLFFSNKKSRERNTLMSSKKSMTMSLNSSSSQAGGTSMPGRKSSPRHTPVTPPTEDSSCQRPPLPKGVQPLADSLGSKPTERQVWELLTPRIQHLALSDGPEASDSLEQEIKFLKMELNRCLLTKLLCSAWRIKSALRRP